MSERRHEGWPGPTELDLPPTPGELRSALTAARRRWRLQQEALRSGRSPVVDPSLGQLARHCAELGLELARREEWLMGHVVEHLEAIVHGRAPEPLPGYAQHCVDEAVRLLVWHARQYQTVHGHLPEEGFLRSLQI